LSIFDFKKRMVCAILGWSFTKIEEHCALFFSILPSRITLFDFLLVSFDHIFPIFPLAGTAALPPDAASGYVRSLPGL
jgi:hypothetical protein